MIEINMSSQTSSQASSQSDRSGSWFTKGSRWYIYFTSILPILFGSIAIIVGVYMLINHKSGSYVPNGSIQVDSATVVDYSCGSTLSGSPCQVTIEYIVGNYHNRETIPTHEHYNVGDSVIVCVSATDNSKITRVGALPTINPWVLIGVGSAFVLLMVGNNWLVSKSSTAANLEGGMAAFNFARKTF